MVGSTFLIPYAFAASGDDQVRLYKNDDFHFQMKLSNGWDIIKSVTNEEIIYLYKSLPEMREGKPVTAIIQVKKPFLTSFFKTLSELPPDKIERMKSSFMKGESTKLLIEGTIRHIGNKKVIWIVTSEENIKILRVIWAENGYICDFSTTFPTEYYDRVKLEMENAIEAFTIEITAEQWYEKGHDYLKCKDYNNAILAYNKAAEVLTNYGNVYLFRAIAYEGIKKYDLAIKDYSKWIELQADREIADFVYSQRAKLFMKLHQYEYALSDYTKVIELKPQYMESYIYRGITYQRMKKDDLAQKEFSRVLNYYTDTIENSPEKASNYRLRGNVYGWSGMYKEAINDLEKSISLNQQDAMAYFLLAQAYELIGKKEEAFRNYQIAYTLDFTFKDHELNDQVTKMELRFKGDWNSYKEWI